MPQVLPPSSSQPPNADVPLPLLRVRLSNVSATMATPVPELDKTHSGFSPDLASLGPSKTQAKKRFFKVPVIRVFGVTEAGQVSPPPTRPTELNIHRDASSHLPSFVTFVIYPIAESVRQHPRRIPVHLRQLSDRREPRPKPR